jgi:RimJ/RimL family protein N-acetyltransferase
MIREFSNIKNDIYAKIKIDNVASIKAFEKAGYEKKYYILEPINKNYKEYEK